MNLGRLLWGIGKPAEAVASFRSAVAVMESVATLTGGDVYNLACCQAGLVGPAEVRDSGVSDLLIRGILIRSRIRVFACPGDRVDELQVGSRIGELGRVEVF